MWSARVCSQLCMVSVIPSRDQGYETDIEDPSLHELVKDGVNGLVFNNAVQLAEQLEVCNLVSVFDLALPLISAVQTLLAAHPSSPALAALRASLQHAEASSPISYSSLRVSPTGEREWEWGTWTQNWDRVVRPLVLRDVGGDEL